MATHVPPEDLNDIHLMILFRVATQDGDFKLKGRALETLYTLPNKGVIGSSIKHLVAWGILSASPYNPTSKQYTWIQLEPKGLLLCRNLVTFARDNDLL